MKTLKNVLLILLLSCFSGISLAQISISEQAILDKQHPRILLLKGEERQIEQSITSSTTWKKMHEAILKECDNIIELPPVERIQIGRRLLDKSREALRRIFHLSYAYRMTGQDKYFQRCEKEMLAISRFSDWNPSHFLDVAEMTMAASIGYDWLYPNLSDESKKVIRDAIVSKGIYPSLDPKYNSWHKVVNNWNQVCNAGMTYGALAVAEDHPGLSKIIIDRALNTIHLSMDEYKPDGAYPEGYNYWDYGTSFNVMFLSAIEKALGSDFGLTEVPGFLQTGLFLQNMTGVTGKCFNWGDCRVSGNLSPAMFWFAQKNADPSLLWVEKTYLQKEDYSEFTDDRLMPAIMIWGKDLPLNQVIEPKVKAWKGQGANPIAMMRTSWSDPNAIYLGFKAGSPSVNHGHMDIGSFILEANGIRWASDFGMQEYESLESKGIALFGRTQDAQRWTVFRLNNLVHNTLTIDGQLQRVKGYAKIDRFSDNPDFMYAVSDISSVYEDQLSSAKRGVAIVDRKFVVVTDELVADVKPVIVRWTMLTTASPKIGNNTITLTKEGRQLVLKVNSSSAVTMKTWTTQPTTSYDAPNPGTTLVGFEMKLEANQKQAIQVLLIPDPEKNKKVKFEKALGNW
ncbi:MAG TPA: heparinase II/III family protein [Prolixibacteraceae bacterium]|nr:heparinase II/III family protein [Prolixibacteraceae bacterium]